VIPDDLGNRANNLAIAINVLKITDTLTYQTGNRLLTEAHTALKELEAARVKLKKPITDLGKAIDGVVAGVADPLEKAKRSMQGMVAAYDRAQREALEKAQREAEEKIRQEREAAEKERARLQAIADAEHAAKVADAKAKADAEAKELEEILGKPVESTPVQVAPATVVAAAAPTTVIPVAAPLPKAVAQVVQVPVLTVTDPAALAAFLVAQGRADLVEFKMRDIKAMHDAGVPVAGVAIVMRDQTRMARGVA
jgi:F0F1-type ATP synthase membrane subunit b/b'